MKFRLQTIATTIALTAVSSFAGETVFIQVPAAIDPAAPIPPAVLNECAVDMLLGNYALSAMGGSGGVAQPSSSQAQAGNDKFVQLTVLSVHGLGGGAWSGPKSMTVRVDLKRGESIIGSTVLSRSSTGGAFATFKGTCEILDRVAKTLGKDVAKWVANPSKKLPSDKPAAASATQESE